MVELTLEADPEENGIINAQRDDTKIIFPRGRNLSYVRGGLTNAPDKAYYCYC